MVRISAVVTLDRKKLRWFLVLNKVSRFFFSLFVSPTTKQKSHIGVDAHHVEDSYKAGQIKP